jgi:hypothetical protein
MRLISYHAGVSVARIEAKTGFEFEISNGVHETHPPSKEELHLIRQEVDPYGIRRLELLSGTQRRLLLHEIISQESKEIRSQS